MLELKSKYPNYKPEAKGDPTPVSPDQLARFLPFLLFNIFCLLFSYILLVKLELEVPSIGEYAKKEKKGAFIRKRIVSLISLERRVSLIFVICGEEILFCFQQKEIPSFWRIATCSSFLLFFSSSF